MRPAIPETPSPSHNFVNTADCTAQALIWINFASQTVLFERNVCVFDHSTIKTLFPAIVKQSEGEIPQTPAQP